MKYEILRQTPRFDTAPVPPEESREESLAHGQPSKSYPPTAIQHPPAPRHPERWEPRQQRPPINDAERTPRSRRSLNAPIAHQRGPKSGRLRQSSQGRHDRAPQYRYGHGKTKLNVRMAGASVVECAPAAGHHHRWHHLAPTAVNPRALRYHPKSLDRDCHASADYPDWMQLPLRS